MARPTVGEQALRYRVLTRGSWGESMHGFKLFIATLLALGALSLGVARGQSAPPVRFEDEAQKPLSQFSVGDTIVGVLSGTLESAVKGKSVGLFVEDRLLCLGIRMPGARVAFRI